MIWPRMPICSIHVCQLAILIVSFSLFLLLLKTYMDLVDHTRTYDYDHDLTAHPIHMLPTHFLNCIYIYLNYIVKNAHAHIDKHLENLMLWVSLRPNSRICDWTYNTYWA